MTASIPTMPCPECDGQGYRCHGCHGAGSIERPPLTPAEIASLPDGAIVYVEWHAGGALLGDVMRADDGGVAFGITEWLRPIGTAEEAARVWVVESRVVERSDD